MILLQSVTEISKAESVAVFVLVIGAIYLYYRLPPIPSAREVFTPNGADSESRFHSSEYGSYFAECPYCGAKNDSVYIYCHRCTGRLHP